MQNQIQDSLSAEQSELYRPSFPKNWEEISLHNLARWINGKAFTGTDFNQKGLGLPILKIAEIKNGISDQTSFTDKEYDKEIFIKTGDILFPWSGTPETSIDILIWNGVNGWLNQHTFKVVPNSNMDKEFFYYLLRYLKVNFIKIASNKQMTGLGHVTVNDLKNLKVRIPGQFFQKKISLILSTLDKKIELNNKIAKNLEETAQTIFKEWFVNFRFPGYGKIKFVDSELGNIPTDWNVGNIKDLINIISGYPFSSKLYDTEKGLGVVTIKNVQDADFITECSAFIREEAVPSKMSQDCRLTDGSILLSLTGNVGRVCFTYGGKYLLNQRVAKLVPIKKENKAFTYFMFRQTPMQNYLINLAKGSAQPNLSPVETGNIRIVIPSFEVLDNFNKIAAPIYTKLVDIRNGNQKLTALRDLLLPKLMKGEIRV